MKRTFGIVVIFALLYLCQFPVTYLKYIREENAEFETLRLSLASDFAAEAAMISCMSVEDVGVDYANNPIILLSPEKAAETFAALMCLNWSLPATELNMARVLNSVPAMLLVENDGFYLAEHIASNDVFQLRWNSKQPFFIETDSIIYGVDFARNSFSMVNKSLLTYSTNNNYAAFPYSGEDVLQRINLQLNREINAALGNYAKVYNLPERQLFYLHVSEGATGVKRMERPGLLVIIQNLSMDGGIPRSLSVVGGLNAAERRAVVGWTDTNGEKWYKHSVGDIVEGEELFYTIDEAAKAGYWPWMN